MAWLDSRIWAHPKLINLSDRAWRIYVSAIAYSSGFLTEGRLNPVQLRTLGVTPRVKRELIEAGLWHEKGREIVIHDWEEHNGKREQKRLNEREQARERKRRQRQREAENAAQLALDVTRDTHRDVTRDKGVTNSVTSSRARAQVTDDGGPEGPSSSVHADDDNLLQTLLQLRPTPDQQHRWTQALEHDPDRIRACLAKAKSSGRNAAAYLDELVRNGSHPLDEPPPEQQPALPVCPECGPIGLPPGTTLADHRRNVHDIDDDAEPSLTGSTTADQRPTIDA